MSLDIVEQMAEELSQQDQMRLIAHLSDRLASGRPYETGRRYQERMLAALALCDSIAESIHGEFDSAADLSAIREERAGR